jgi:hypothetical protein
MMQSALIVLSAAFLTSEASAQDENAIYVSLQGKDTWSGRFPEPNASKSDGPFRTLSQAAKVIQPGQTCYLRKGTYRETLKPARSGAPDRPITFRNYKNETPVISGADVLSGWTQVEGRIHRAPMNWDRGDQNQLFAGGKMLTEARWPNNTGTLLQPIRASAASGTANTLADPKLPGGDGTWKGAHLWCAGGKRWYCWTEKVTKYDAAKKTLTFDKPQPKDWYRIVKGSPYVLIGVRAALDAEGEWWFDRANRQVYLCPPRGIDLKASTVEAARRAFCIDLSGRSHVRIEGVAFRAGGVQTDDKTSNILLKRCTGRYVAHSYVKDVSSNAGVRLRGRDNEINSCELAWCSGSLLNVAGSGHRIVNCLLHDGNYAGKWKGAVALAGRKILFSHNTVRDSGRDLVSIHGLMEGLIQHNDLSNAGWITWDLGMTYGHNTDFMNTVIRYNVVHDNRSKACSMGIYFDHCSHNVIVHNNVVYGTGDDPIRLNNPSYFGLVYNNSCSRSGAIRTFDHSRRNDVFGLRYVNNIINKDIKLPSHAVVESNLKTADPGYETPQFTLRSDSPAVDAAKVLPGVTDRHVGRAPDLGAFERGKTPWKAGHDFARSPSPVWEAPDIIWMNLVRNSCFELNTLESWKKTGAGEVKLAPGNGWGNKEVGQGRHGKHHETGTSKRELRLGKGRAGVEQVIERLHPGTAYTLSAWLRVSDAREKVRVGVRHSGGREQSESSSDPRWVRKTVDFTTGTGQTRVTIFLEKTTDAGGYVFCDNLGLPHAPRGFKGR